MGGEGGWKGLEEGKRGEDYVSVFELRTYENKRHNYCKHFYIKYLESPNFIKQTQKYITFHFILYLYSLQIYISGRL